MTHKTNAHLQSTELIKAVAHNPEKQSGRLLTRSEVEEHFGIRKRYLEIAAVRGEGPPMIKIGRSVRYLPRDIEEWIEAQRVVPPG